MSSSLSDHKIDEEALIDLAINEGLLTDQLESTKMIDEIEMVDITIPTQANIKNTNTDVVSLIDISHNKKWVCYISHLRNQSAAKGESPYMLDKDDKKITYITRHRLIKEDEEQENLSGGELKSDIQNSTAISIPYVQQEQVSTNITQYTLSDNTNSYCKFLSISPDGQFAALSFIYYSDIRISKSLRPDIGCCHIFKVDDYDNFQYCFTREHATIPVFLDTGSDSLLCLALINEFSIYIYNNFQGKIDDKVGYSYTMQSYFPKSNVSECIAFHTPFIEEVATWTSIENSEDKTDAYSNQALEAITLSRHIRDNIIVTPFVGGTVRAWSIKDNGIRLTSFFAPDEHVTSFSIDYRLVATLTDGIRGAKIYDVKSGMLISTLHSTHCFSLDENTCFYVSHATFCYDSRYLALSLVLKTTDSKTKLISTKVVFEVWYIEAEKLIYLKTERTGVNYALGDTPPKTLQPFVTEITTKDKDRYLKGVFSCQNQEFEEIKYVDLDIDGDSMMNTKEVQDSSVMSTDSSRYNRKENSLEVIDDYDGASNTIAQDNNMTSNQEVRIEWIESNTYIPDSEYYEISNELDDYSGIRCGNIYIGDKKKYLVRLGKHMIQLWRLGNSIKGKIEDGELVYIRAYNCPYLYYRLVCLFDVPWEIDSYESIKFVGGISEGRMIVNIKKAQQYYECSEDYSGARYSANRTAEGMKKIYYTEEVFLPISSKFKSGTEENSKVYQHLLESAFQALYYLFNSSALHEVSLKEETNNIKKSVSVEKPQYKEYVERYEKVAHEEFRDNNNQPQLKKTCDYYLTKL